MAAFYREKRCRQYSVSHFCAMRSLLRNVSTVTLEVMNLPEGPRPKCSFTRDGNLRTEARPQHVSPLRVTIALVGEKHDGDRFQRR